MNLPQNMPRVGTTISHQLKQHGMRRMADAGGNDGVVFTMVESCAYPHHVLQCNMPGTKKASDM